jgi:hypothetical protein
MGYRGNMGTKMPLEVCGCAMRENPEGSNSPML